MQKLHVVVGRRFQYKQLIYKKSQADAWLFYCLLIGVTAHQLV